MDNETYSVSMKCKDFDAWLSFLGRLVKLGTNYIIRNDIIIPVTKGIDKKTEDKIPGKHVVRDPLMMSREDYETYSVVDGVYLMNDPELLISTFKTIMENDKTTRKNIMYVREKRSIRFYLGNVEVDVAKLFVQTSEEVSPEIDAVLKTAATITWFDDLIEPYDGGEDRRDSEWTPFIPADLIHLRNNGVLRIASPKNSRVHARLARSLFYMAGVTRLDTPIAEMARFLFVPSEHDDVSLLRIHAIYKCGTGSSIVLNVIHDYLCLVYDDGKGAKENAV